MTHDTTQPLTLLGWREWVALPDLGIERLKCKVDTGARTSALHAFSVEPFTENGVERVRFRIHPIQDNQELEKVCVADILDRRVVSDSGGHREERICIKTRLVVAGSTFDAELTLTDRDSMKFRMLLGRTAMNGRFAVNPAASFLHGV